MDASGEVPKIGVAAVEDEGQDGEDDEVRFVDEKGLV